MVMSAFEKQWQRKYSEAAKEDKKDHQISLWSKEGLAAYIKYFFIYFRPHIKKDNSQTLVLDLGCGPGTFSRLLAQKGFSVYATDYSSKVIEIAKKRTINERIDYRAGDIYNLPFSDNFFDIIICLGVFQTVDNLQPAFDEIASKLKPGGIFVLTALNRFSISSTKKQHPRLRRFNPYNFRNILIENGRFREAKLKGMFFFPQKFSIITWLIIKLKIYKFFNFFFPLFNFLSHSFYIESRKTK